jgi:hypothetical protein
LEPSDGTGGLHTGPQDVAEATNTVRRDGESRDKSVRSHGIIETGHDSPAAGLLQLLDDIPLSSVDNEAVTSANGSNNVTSCDSSKFA